MKGVLKKVLSLLLCILVLKGNAGTFARADEYPGHFLMNMESKGKSEFFLAPEDVQAYDAALMLMDASVNLQELWNDLCDAQDSYAGIFALMDEGKDDNRISIVYFLHNNVWKITSSPSASVTSIELLSSRAAPYTQAETEKEIREIAPNHKNVRSDYFWHYVMQIFVFLTGGQMPQESQSQSGVGGPGEWKPTLTPASGGWPVIIDLVVEMEITDDMCDFVFCVNNEEYIDANADRENGRVTGVYEARKNGFYVFTLGYRKNGNDVMEEFDITVDSIDESLIPDEEHVHVYILDYISDHPHAAYLCTCGDILSEDTEDALLIDPNCCECGYHEWGDAYRASDGVYYSFCYRCNLKKSCKPEESQYILDTLFAFDADPSRKYEYLRSDGTKGSVTAWRGLGAQAIERLQDRLFVGGNELILVYSDMAGTLVDLVTDAPSEEVVRKHKVEIWEKLIADMLTAGREEIDPSMFENGAMGMKLLTSVGKEGNKVDEAFDALGELLDDTEIGEKIEDVIDAFSDKSGIEIEFDPDEKADPNSTEAFGYMLNILSSMASGLDAASEVKKMYNDMVYMLIDYENNMDALNELIDSARKLNNDTLLEAALNTKERLKEQAENAVSYFADVMGAAAKATAGSTAEWAAPELIEAAIKRLAPEAGSVFSILSVVEAAASVTKFISSEDEAYASALEMMTLMDMQSSISLYSLKQVEDAYYIGEVWTRLQLMGVQEAKKFLSYMDKANNLHDLGLKNTWHVDNLLTNSEYDYMELIETMRGIHKDYNS